MIIISFIGLNFEKWIMRKNLLLLVALFVFVVINGSILAMHTIQPSDIKEFALFVPGQGIVAPNPSRSSLFEDECGLRKSFSFDEKASQALFKLLSEEQKKSLKYAQDDLNISSGASSVKLLIEGHQYCFKHGIKHCTGIRMFEKRNK